MGDRDPAGVTIALFVSGPISSVQCQREFINPKHQSKQCQGIRGVKTAIRNFF
jgi:hypothetical protein